MDLCPFCSKKYSQSPEEEKDLCKIHHEQILQFSYGFELAWPRFL